MEDYMVKYISYRKCCIIYDRVKGLSIRNLLRVFNFFSWLSLEIDVMLLFVNN